MVKNDEIGIYCPYCGERSNGKIIDTRPTYGGRRRRRVCENCGKRFTTIESCHIKYVNLYEQNMRGDRNGNK